MDGDNDESGVKLKPDVERFLEDTLRSCVIQSPVPAETLQEECCMGIDEAGRGPVLGQLAR